MLRRTFRKLFYNGADPIGKVHPDVLWGWYQLENYGPGWVACYKQVPQEGILLHGGSVMGSAYDKQGIIQDPEDPRHPIIRMQIGERQGFDGALQIAAVADYGPIPPGARLLQVLYDNYLEPFSCHRVAGMLKSYEKCPNSHPGMVWQTVDYYGDTMALVGEVIVSVGSVILESTVMRGDTNSIYLAEGCMIMENVMICSDAPTTLHHYQRSEAFNPYQTFEAIEGVARLGNNCIIEPNCTLDSCQLGPFNKIGHNSKIMKGVTSGTLVHVLPGSVVVQDTCMHDGELWGGAPARKLGKISKFEWKKPFEQSCCFRDMVCEQQSDSTRWGDQTVYYYDAMDSLTTLCLDYEHDLGETVKAQMRHFVEGREPYSHTVARITQGWSPAARTEEKHGDNLHPNICFNQYVEHNSWTGDSQSNFIGTYFNLKNFIAEKRW